MTGHSEIEDLLGVYALDALDDEQERRLVEEHLAGCARCRAEVDEHRDTAAMLARTGSQAPPGVWDRISGELAGEAAPPPLRLVVDQGPVVPRRSLRRRMATFGAVAAAVAIFALTAGVLRQQSDLDRLGRQQDLAGAATAAFAAADARTTDLVTDDGTVLARAAVLPDGTGYLLASDLPDLEDHIYQLWGSDGESVVSLGPLGSHPEIVPFNGDPSLVVMMITEEEAPVESSSNPPVVTGEFA